LCTKELAATACAALRARCDLGLLPHLGFPIDNVRAGLSGFLLGNHYSISLGLVIVEAIAVVVKQIFELNDSNQTRSAK
jgi:hypothetical protein